MKYIFLIFGGMITLMAIFANQLGIDNDTGWGGGRTLLLKVGLVIFLFGLMLLIFRAQLQKLQIKVRDLLHSANRDVAIGIVFAFIAVLTAFGYNWLLRDKSDSDKIYNYYSELAKGFRSGNLYLPETPSPALLAMENPYDTALRKQMDIEDFPWDVTLYKGRFYIYWGPTPAFLLLPFSDDFLANIEDFHLTLVFAFGLFLYSAVTVTTLWKRLKSAPVWMLAILLLVLGFSVPMTTMLGRGEVYEAAIFACQFFFIGGCYWASMSLMDASPIPWKFALAALHWAFAIGARVTILPAVAIAALIMCLPMLFTTQARLKPLIAAVLPLLAGGAALAWYNWARFGSIFEFGIRYQLANVDYTQFKGSFGLQYIAENLRVYFLHPVNFQSRYPFLSMVEYTASNDRLSGLLYIAPFIVLIFLPLYRLVFRMKENTHYNKVLVMYTGAAMVSAIFIFTFYFITLRYTLDFLPSTLIAIAVSLGLEYEAWKEKRFITSGISSLVSALALVNVTMGILLASPESGTAFMLNFLNSASKLLGLK